MICTGSSTDPCCSDTLCFQQALGMVACVLAVPPMRLVRWLVLNYIAAPVRGRWEEDDSDPCGDVGSLEAGDRCVGKEPPRGRQSSAAA